MNISKRMSRESSGKGKLANGGGKKDRHRLFAFLFGGFGGLILILVIVFVICNSVGDGSWVLKSGEYEISSGEYLFYVTQNLLSAKGNLEASNASADFALKDVRSKFLEGEVEGKPALVFVNDSTIDFAKKVLYANKTFDELGLEIPADEKEKIDEQLKSQYGSLDEKYKFSKIGISFDSFKKVVECNQKLDKMKSKLFDAEDGEHHVSDAEVKEYITHHCFKYKMISIPKSLDSTDNKQGDDGDSVLKKEGVASTEELVKKYMAWINDGKSIDEVYAAFVSSSSNSATDDAEGKKLEEQLQFDEGNFSGKDVVVGAEIGKVVSGEDMNCRYIVKRLELGEEDFEKLKPELSNKLGYDRFLEFIENGAEALDVSVNSGLCKKYDSLKQLEVAMSEGVDDLIYDAPPRRSTYPGGEGDAY